MERKLDRTMYLSDREIEKLRSYWKEQATLGRTPPVLRRIRKGQSYRKKTRGQHLWMIVDLALSTGLRVSELAALRVEDFDWEEGTIRVVRRKKRATKPVTDYLPLSEALAKHLSTYLEGRTSGIVIIGIQGPLTRRGWQGAWNTACKRAGIRPLSIHKARHTCATVLYRHTHDLRLVQVQLGHSRMDITERYAHVSFDEMKKAAEKMYDE